MSTKRIHSAIAAVEKFQVQYKLHGSVCGGIRLAIQKIKEMKLTNLHIDIYESPTEMQHFGGMEILRNVQEDGLCCSSCQKNAEARAMKKFKRGLPLRPCRFILVTNREFFIKRVVNLIHLPRTIVSNIIVEYIHHT